MPLDIEVRYEISEDMMEAHKTGTTQIKNGIARINAGSMKPTLPGFRQLSGIWIQRNIYGGIQP